jgi:hypothetical protein
MIRTQSLDYTRLIITPDAWREFLIKQYGIPADDQELVVEELLEWD